MIAVCMKLEQISPPFAEGTLIELKFKLPACNGCEGGELRMRVLADRAERYRLGDEYHIRIREIV
jgi:hypothetical protein